MHILADFALNLSFISFGEISMDIFRKNNIRDSMTKQTDWSTDDVPLKEKDKSLIMTC